MFLRTLELQGFKSFPDKTILNFGKGITAVVGPNGSGKSNIADAVRWVLGEQSTKTLRGARMEDVIFGGTSIRKALGYAEVTLRLDNIDRSLEKCDRDEVSVTRRYYRSGESEYLINGETVRLRDINELFMDTGLGRDGYSMVSQGRVADMISSRSSQRRDILEEASGISAFRYRRQDALRQLERAEDNLSRLRDILSELESRIGPLKTQSEKAQKYIVLAADKKELEIGLWLYAIEKAKTGLKEQEHKLSVATAQYEAAEKELSETEESLEQFITDGQSITAEIENIRQSASEIEEEASRIDADVAVEKNTLEHNSAAIERITRDLQQAAEDDSTLDEQNNEALAEIERLRSVIADQNKKLAEATDDLGGIRDENAAFAEQSASVSDEISNLTVALSEKKIESSSALTSVEEIKTRSANIEGVIKTRGPLLEKAQQDKKECEKELEAEREKVTELTNYLSGYQLREKKRREKADALKNEMDELDLDIHQKRARIKMLEDLEKNMEGYSGAVRAVIKESKRGMLRGIHGAVSQLINVESKYATAVETAFGPAIQNIVTDNETDAKRAIEYLKSSRAGRATFLPMTAIRSKPFTEKGLDDCVGFVAMADELVSYDKKYDEIIKSLLARTAVAEDLDSAIAISKKYGYRFRTVTLDGQIVNAGGSMTGGSGGHNLGILSRSGEIEKLGIKVNDLSKLLESKQATYKSMIEELASIGADISGAEADLKRATDSVIRKEGELNLLSGRVETISNALSEMRAEKDKNDKRTEALNAAIKAAEGEAKEIEGRISELKQKLVSLGRSRELLEEKKEELSKLEADIGMSILAAQKDIDAKLALVESYKRIKESNGDRLKDLNDEIAEIAISSREKKENIRQMEEKAAQLREKSAELKENIRALADKRTDIESKSADLRTTERTKNEEKEKLSGELARLEERKGMMENELETSRSKLYDEYQLTQREAEELNIVIEDPPKSQRALQEIKNKIRALGNVNVGAVEEYKEVSERYEYMSGQLEDVERSKEELTRLIGDLTGKMAERFREQFNKINSFFRETFAELFDGGKAELVLDDPSDVLECNISLKVQPPGKNVQNIDLLSGGEKGLSAISLLFAILKVSPSPFCIFDEVEAALDDVNVTRYAEYVRRMTKNTQFILITHRRGTMEEADILYGVTMQEEGVSKLLELKTAEMAKRLGVE
ncbi:MAG: chromosome segregation protein SMC [Clostridiales bacterium]|nr:chromosome segregation protein SMC [Clostridiales bacterium]